jgi:bacteriocin-like protein
MKKLNKNKLKEIKGGTNTRLCLRICLIAYNRCTLINGDTVQCEEAYNACTADCYQIP